MALENPPEEKAYAAWLEGINAEAEERGLSRRNWPKTREQFNASSANYYRYFQAGCTPAETFEQILAWAKRYDPKGPTEQNMPPRPTPPPQARPKPYLN